MPILKGGSGKVFRSFYEEGCGQAAPHEYVSVAIAETLYNFSKAREYFLDFLRDDLHSFKRCITSY
jgi:hypothetical protein